MKMQSNRKRPRAILLAGSIVGVLLLSGASTVFAGPSFGQERPATSSLTPQQLEIEKQRMRLSSTEAEDRRDALTRLASMHNPDASRVALAGLRDPVAIVKVSAAGAILSLPAEERSRNLIPLLSDEDEFVRRETAYALGKTESRTAVPPLVELLLNDKLDSVRGAAVVALGEIRDETAVAPLASVLNPQLGLVGTKRSQKKKKPENPFVLRATARSLGQIGSRAALPALIHTLQDEQGEADVRRESAVALGAVGDSSALPALREALTAIDPYLSQAAQESIKKIQRSNSH
jgi:HEAT repeat protein